MGKGYIKLHRDIQDHWIWNTEPFSKGQAWIDLLMLANHEDTKIPYKGKIVICRRGDVCRSISSLATRWKWSIGKARRFLLLLQEDGMLIVNATRNRTTITIVNYGKFQDPRTTNEHLEEQRANNEWYINKNEKNDNNNPLSIAPTRDEVEAYLTVNGMAFDIDAFMDYYQARGWKVNGSHVEDWQALVRNWDRKGKSIYREKKGGKSNGGSTFTDDETGTWKPDYIDFGEL